MISIRLPFPPSVNSYWRHPTRGKLAGRHLISEEGRRYRTMVAQAVHDQKVGFIEAQSISVRIVAHPPDRRRRDLDNMLKGLLDSLTHARIWTDDYCVDVLEIRRGCPIKGGLLIVDIKEVANDNVGAT